MPYEFRGGAEQAEPACVQNKILNTIKCLQFIHKPSKTLALRMARVWGNWVAECAVKPAFRQSHFDFLAGCC